MVDGGAFRIESVVVIWEPIPIPAIPRRLQAWWRGVDRRQPVCLSPGDRRADTWWVDLLAIVTAGSPRGGGQTGWSSASVVIYLWETRGVSRASSNDPNSYRRQLAV